MAAAALIAGFLVSASVVPSAAQEPPPPIGAELLTDRAVFTDNVDLKVKAKLDGEATQVVNVKNPSRTVTARFTVQPGAEFGWHTHAGPVIVNVVEGELTFVDSRRLRGTRIPGGEPPLSTSVTATSTTPSTPRPVRRFWWPPSSEGPRRRGRW